MGFGERLRLRSAGRDLSRACRAVGVRERRHARFRHLGALRAASSDEASTRSTPVQWPCARGRSAPTDRVSSPTAVSSRPTAGRASSRAEPPRCAPRPVRRLSARPQHRPRPRPVAHHDAHGLSPRLAQHTPEPFVEVHPDDADGAGARRRRFRASRHPHGAGVSRSRQRGPAARLSVRADPLERRDRLDRARRRLVRRRPIRYSGQPEAKATPARSSRSHSPIRGFALTRRPIRRRRTPGGRGSRSPAASARSSRQRTTRSAGATRGAMLGTRELAEFIDHGVAFIAPRLSRRAAHRRCSSAPAGPRRNGMPSRRCSRGHARR